MSENVIFRYKNGHIIPIKVDNKQTTNNYMNDKIRNVKKEYKMPIEMIQYAYNKSKNDYNDNFAEAYISEISPDDFLKLTTTPSILSDIIDDPFRTFDLNLDKLNESYMMLEIDMKTGKILQHEGRHRMLALKNAGYKKAEIIVYAGWGTADRYNPLTYKNLKVFNQINGEYSTNIEKIIPLNKENFEKIKNKR